MNLLKFIVFPALLLILSTPFLSSGKQSRKPLPPIQISITPEEGFSPHQLRPGDMIRLTVAAVSLRDTEEMRIQVDLRGGAKLISGDASWRGPARKGEEKKLMMTVQAPEHGIGTVRARVSLPPSKGTRFSAEAYLKLGLKVGKKPEQEPALKKDSRGRDVIEYR